MRDTTRRSSFIPRAPSSSWLPAVCRWVSKRDADYKEGRTQLQHGDVLVIYSDGVTEATSPSAKSLDRRVFTKWCSRNIEASAAGIRDRIESALTKFAQGTRAADDITLVIVKRQVEKAAVAAS